MFHDKRSDNLEKDKYTISNLRKENIHLSEKINTLEKKYEILEKKYEILKEDTEDIKRAIGL
tara:strand:- start:881 stop:1066 length:186 start_codon:yes stop_codon:yes gene_type:complete